MVSRMKDKKIGYFKKLTKLFFVMFLTGSIFFLGFTAYISKDLPNPNKIMHREIPLTTKIYDRTGEQLLYEIYGGEKRTMVELTNIPKYVINATLTAEDREFYEHKGFSITGIARSIIKNASTGGKVGGSTITQQLVKNAILTPEKTYSRKLKEAILAYRIEKKFKKDDILKMYFNEIPYGSVIYGIEAASQAFFGKNVKDVSIGQGAILAAIPKAPTYYSPNGNHVDKLTLRQHWILDSMAELKYITKEEAENAKKEKLEFKKPQERIIAPHFVLYVREYLSQKYGEKTVGQGGLKVITTLDFTKQKIAEEVIDERAEKNQKDWNASNAALVSLDAKTGQILAMVGSKDYFNEEIDGQVNVSLRPRQPGSSFKPIVYAAAFKKGYTPTTVVFDVNTKFKNYDGKFYEPKNYDLKEHGPVTLRSALAGSLNIPAVKTIYLTGINKVLDLANDLGYTTLQERWRFGLSLVLGGGEVKLLEHTRAFSVFAQEGELHELSAILKVEDKNGKILEEYQDHKTKILETQVARLINDILSDNSSRSFIFGNNNSLVLKDRPVAAKTGTTNDYRDSWTVGYTPTLVTGVWVGNNDFSSMKRGADGSLVAAPIWNGYMSKALAGGAVEYFQKPNLISSDNPALSGAMKEGVKARVDTISGKLATELTPLEYVEERTYRQLHSILYYVNKDNPQGPPPQNPASDQEFQAWEDAIADWGKRNNITPEEAPTEFDDIHVPENEPRLTILSPAHNEILAGRNITVDVSAVAPLGVQRVEYYLAGKLIGEKYSSPYIFSAYIDNNKIPNGKTTLRVAVYDASGNTKQDFVDVILDFEEISLAATLEYPTSGSIITEGMFPLNINVRLNSPENVGTVSVYAQAPNKTKLFINSTNQISNNALIPWQKYPGGGIYEIYFTVNNKDEFFYQGEKVLVEIK